MFLFIIVIISYCLIISLTKHLFESGDKFFSYILLVICIVLPFVVGYFFYRVYNPREKKEKTANREELINIIFNKAQAEGEVWWIYIKSKSFSIRNRDGTCKSFCYKDLGYTELNLNAVNVQNQFRDVAEKKHLNFKVSERFGVVKGDTYSLNDSGTGFSCNAEGGNYVSGFVIFSNEFKELFCSDESLKSI